MLEVALGGSFKLVMLAPRTVREMTQLPQETQKRSFLANHLIIIIIIRAFVRRTMSASELNLRRQVVIT